MVRALGKGLAGAAAAIVYAAIVGVVVYVLITSLGAQMVASIGRL